VSRTDAERITDALTHIDILRSHLTRGTLADATVADAVALRLAAAIEALHTRDGALEERLFGTGWHAIWSVRNRIAHGYAVFDLTIIRATVERDLPEFEERLRRGLDEQRTEAGDPR